MKNNLQCQVYIWDKLVGEMTQVRGKIYFKYDADFEMEISPISLALSKAQYEFRAPLKTLVILRGKKKR